VSQPFGVGGYACPRLNLVAKGKALRTRGQGFKPDLRNSAVRHYRGASENVAMAELRTHLATERVRAVTLRLKHTRLSSIATIIPQKGEGKADACVKAFVKLDAPHPRSARPPLTPGFAPRTTRRRSLTRIRVSAQEPAIQVRTRRLRHKIATLGTPGLLSPRNYSYETESAFSSQL
jgi:hypothetical protein